MEKLILIDGNAILHRAYHALPPSLTTPDGQPVNAVYGFFGMLLKILEEQKPEYLIVCFDRVAPTFRQTLFAGYHENRPKMADDLVSQVDIIHDVLTKMKVCMMGVDGYEADDLIGTLAHQATTDYRLQTTAKKSSAVDRRQWTVDEVIIVTGDRDMLQLINSHVKVLMPILGITKMTLMDEKAVEEKYGVTPAQFIDYKALIGDASDNYPGVAGIGPKTAASLLQKLGTFENLYKHLDQVSAKIAGQLATDAEQAALAKKLATILTDAPITLDKKDCTVSGFDIPAAQAAFEALGIKSLQKRLPGYTEEVVKVAKVEKVEARKKNTDQLELI